MYVKLLYVTKILSFAYRSPVKIENKNLMNKTWIAYID